MKSKIDPKWRIFLLNTLIWEGKLRDWRLIQSEDLLFFRKHLVAQKVWKLWFR